MDAKTELELRRRIAAGDARAELELRRAVAGGVTDAVTQYKEAAQTYGKQQLEHVVDATRNFFGRAPNADYSTGVQDRRVRQEYALRDDQREKENYLNQTFGPQGTGWFRDPGGDPIIMPKGLLNIGQDAAKPTAFDETGLTLRDVYEFGSEAASPIAGSAIGATIGAPFGPPGALLGGVLGAAGGRGWQETWEALSGRNQQSGMEVAKDIADEATYSAFPVQAGKQAVLDPLGRKVLAPHSNQMGAKELGELQLMRDLNIQPSWNQIVPNPGLSGRATGIAQKILPNWKRKAANVQQLTAHLGRVLNDLPIERGGVEGGRAVQEGLREGRNMLSAFSEDFVYGPIKAIAGDQRLVPTNRTRTAIDDLWSRLPRNADGEIIFLGDDQIRTLERLRQLPPAQTLEEATRLRSDLRGVLDSEQLTRTISGADKDQIYRAMTDDRAAAGMGLGPLIRDADRWYAREIDKFNEGVFKRAVRAKDPIKPEKVVEQIFQPNSPTIQRKVVAAMPPAYREQYRSEVIGKLFRDVEPTGGLVEVIASGKKLNDTLRRYGKETIDSAVGKERSNDLFKLARAMEVMERKVPDYGQLVAAAIAARPIKNLGRIGYFGGLGFIFNSRAGFRMMTEGLQAGNFRAVVSGLSRIAAQGPTAGEGSEE